MIQPVSCDRPLELTPGTHRIPTAPTYTGGHACEHTHTQDRPQQKSPWRLAPPSPALSPWTSEKIDRAAASQGGTGPNLLWQLSWQGSQTLTHCSPGVDGDAEAAGRPGNTHSLKCHTTKASRFPLWIFKKVSLFHCPPPRHLAPFSEGRAWELG